MDDEQNTIYFERLESVIRSTEKGSAHTIPIGDAPGSCELRIRNDFEERKDDYEQTFGIGASTGLSLHLNSINKLEARIDNDITSVSACGKVVTIPFHHLQKKMYAFTHSLFSILFLLASFVKCIKDTFQPRGSNLSDLLMIGL